MKSQVSYVDRLYHKVRQWDAARSRFAAKLGAQALCGLGLATILKKIARESAFLQAAAGL